MRNRLEEKKLNDVKQWTFYNDESIKGRYKDELLTLRKGIPFTWKYWMRIYYDEL